MDKKKIMNWIIAIIVAIVYLTVSIVFKAWAYSWRYGDICDNSYV